MHCSYCRITGLARNLPKPHYPPLTPLSKDASEKRIRFCKITSRSMEDHHYLPSTTPNETEAWARRGSGPCRIMQKSHSMEIHHYIPNFEDLYFSHVEGCKITQKNRPVKDYRYVYPLLLVGEKSDTIEVSELKEMQFSLSYMHHFTEGYQYIFPSFDSLSHRQQTIEGLKQKFDITILSTPKGHEVCKGYKYVYSVCDDLCSLVIPDDIEEVLRCGPVDNIWLTADRKEMVIQIANGKLLQLPTHTLTSEQLHEELEGKTLLPGIAGGKHAVKLIESQRQNLKNKKGSSSLSSQKLTSSAKKKNTPVDVDMGLNIANGYSSPSSIPTEGESLSHSDSNSDILSLDPEDWHSACTSVSPTCALESYCEHKAENGTALLSSFDGTIRNVVNSVEAETVERHLNGDIVNKRSISCGSSSNSSFERNEDQLSGLSGSDLVGVVKPHQEKTINEDTTVECKEVVSSSLFGDILAISGKSEMNLNEEHSPMKQHPVDLSEVRNLCQSSVDVRNKCLSEAEMLQRNVMDHLRASDGVNINLDPTRFSSYSEGRRESGTNLLQSNVNAKGHLTSLNENMSEFTDVDGLATNEINHEKIFELTTTNSNNEVMDQLFSLQGSTVKSSSMMSAVSRSRRLQFFPHETSSNNETAMFVTKNGDLLLGDQQQSKMGNALFKVLSSEDESEKEMITEDEHSLRLHNSDSGQDTPQLQITECLSDSHEEEQQSLQIKEENGHGDKKVHGSSLSNILQDTNIEDKGLPTGRHLTSCEVNDDRNEDSITTNAISKRKSLDEMGDKSDDESLTSRPSSRSDTSPSTLDPVEQLASSMRAAGYTQALHSRDIIEQYVVTTDYTPDSSGVGSVALREGQVVEVLDSTSKYRWLVKTRPSKYLSPRQGWIPASYLEKKPAEMTLRHLHSASESESDIPSDSIEREAAQKRREVVKELVDTEDEFVKDMQHVVNTYLKEMDNPRMPKELRDQKDALFLNFKEICDFHDNVLIRGVQYYAGEPCKLGRTFLRLERDFDMHAKYCQDEPKAQELLATAPVKEYFEEYSKRIGEIDRSLKDHLKLPIQRINDYQLLLKELIKYTTQLKEDCTDLQKALDLLLSIPQRAHDLKYINAIEGFRGNIQKLGRLLRHDWFVVTDGGGRIKERYLFLFSSRIFVTKVRKVTETRPHFILKDIIKLSDVQVKDSGEEKRFEIHKHSGDSSRSKYPLIFEAQTAAIKEAWLKELNCVFTENDIDRSPVSCTDITEKAVQENTEEINIYKTLEQGAREKTPEIIDESRKDIVFEDRRKKIEKPYIIDESPIAETLPNFEVSAKVNKIMTDSIYDGSVPSTDGGDTATLECELHAVPPAIVTWLKDNVPLTQSENVQFVTKGNMNYLVIKNTKNEDSGLYLCKATNSHGTASCSTQLNVQEVEENPQNIFSKAPEFTIKFKDTELLEGTSVRFLIKVRAHPEATIEFLKNNCPLKEDDRIKFITEDQNTFELSIHNITHKDAGKYTCVAQNSVGKNSFSAEVKVTSEKDLFPGVHEIPIMNGGLLKKGEQPEFKWFRGGQEIESSERFKVLFKDDEDTLALVFQHVKPEDAGLYTCVASTSSGRISCSAELSVEGAVKQLMKDPESPKILAHLMDTEVSEGASAMLELKISGYPKPKLTWLKDGVEIKAGGRFKFLHEDDESMALIIKGVTYDDAGKYTVRAKNDLGEVTTNGHLLVKVPPKLKTQMKDTAVMTDALVKFEVVVEGQPTPEVAWYKDGHAVKENDRVKITKKKDIASLEIKKAVIEDSGSYSCIATNTSGKVSEFAMLTVNDPPKFLKELKNTECKESETIKFEAKITGNPEPSVKWLFNGEEIRSDDVHIKIEKDDRNHSLTINKATKKDVGKYSLSAVNDIGSSVSSGSLTVNYPPSFQKQLSNITIKEGETDVKFDVKVSGWPTPKIRWFIESLEISETSKKYKIVNEGETSALIIKQVESDCSGCYSCTISNDYGEVTSKGLLHVLTKPTFTKKIEDITVVEEEDVTFNVTVTGNPSPTLKWLKDKNEVNVSANIKISKVEDGSCSLSIRAVTEESAGLYECHATNTEGEAVTICRLIVHKLKNKDTIDNDTIVEGSYGNEVIIEKEETKSSDMLNYKAEENSDQLEAKKSQNILKKESYSLSTFEQSSFPCIYERCSMKQYAKYSRTIEEVFEESPETSSVHEVTDESFRISEKRSDERIGLGVDELEISTRVKDDNAVDQMSSFTIQRDYCEIGEPVRVKEGITNIPDSNVFDEYVEGTVKKYVVQEKIRDEVEFNNVETNELKQLTEDASDVIQNALTEDSEDNEIKIWDGNPMVDNSEHMMTENQRKKNMIERLKNEGLLDDDSPQERYMTAHPRFECELKDVEVWNGMDAVIEAVGTSIPNPEVKWFKNGEPIEIDKRIKFEDQGKLHRLIIEKTVPEDSGKFRITLKNKLGEISQEGQLTVKASTEALVPIVMKKLEDVVCIMGNHANFEAKIYANPDPEIYWYKDGKELIVSDHIVISENDIKHTYNVTVKNATPDDIGQYSVVARNTHGEVSSEASLDVQEPPLIQEIKDKKTMPDSSVYFETKVTGKPKPSVKWLKGDQELKENDRIRFEYQNDNDIYKLYLSKVTPEDGGRYVCVAENIAAVTKAPFNLSVTTEPPHFIKGLHDRSCKLNNSVHFDVQVYGLPMPAVKWFKDGIEIEEGWKFKMTQSDERNFSLTIEKFGDADSGKYSCKAFNQAGEAITHGSLAMKHALPEFLKQLPKEVCIIDGEHFMLEAKLDNNPMPEVKWLKDGKEIQSDDHVKFEKLPDGTVRLSVESGIPEDKGKYTLIATNEAGEESTSGHVVVEAIPKAPSFLKTLKDADIPCGSELKLSAKVTAHPRPVTKWLKDGKPLRLDARIRLREEPGGCFTLEIDDVKPEDEGKYTLIVSNHRGEASSVSNVKVKSPSTAPEIMQPLKSSNVISGAPCHFEAKIDGNPFPTTKWYKDDAPFTPDGDRIKTASRPDGTVALIFVKTEPQDAGKYTLEAINPCGSVTSDGNLCLTGKDRIGEKTSSPKFVVPLRDIVVDEGKPIKLMAEIEGNPFPELVWTKDGEPIKVTDSLFLTSDGDKIGLEIMKAAPKDTGIYECKLSNPEGSCSSSAHASVTQLFKPPVFSQKISDQFSITGGDPRFVCKVHGFPRPDVTWYFKDVPIEPDNIKYKIKRDGDICVLQVKGASPEDRGCYSCKACNEAGTDVCAANLEISDIGEKRERAEPPSFLKKLGDCSVMEGMTAKFTACVAGFPEPTFKWYKDDKELSTSDHIKFQVEPHGLLRLIIKDATPRDVGNYVLKISNPHGEIETAARLVFDTYEDRKPRERRSDHSINQDKLNKHLDIDSIRDQKYSNEPGEWNTSRDRTDLPNDFDKHKEPQIESSQPNGDIDGHKPLTVGDFTPKVKNRMGDLNIEHDKFRRSAIPLALPDKPIISKMSDRRLTLSWKPSLPIGPSVPVTYIVDMCEVPNGEWFVARSGIRGCCCEIRNLEPFQDYKFRVRVENKYGISDPSPFAVTYRQKLEMTPPKQLPRLPPEFDFRPETSQYFPKDYDIDRPPHEDYAHAPRFLRQSDDTQYAVKGEPASVEWWVYGYPTPSVSFTFKEESVPMGGHYESIVARNGQCKLYLSRMMDKDVGTYECRAVNEHGEARQRLNLAIAEHPVFIMHLEEENIMLRKGGVLHCRVIGVPYPEIKWYKDWHPIVSSNRIKIEWKEPDLCTLTISDSIGKDAGLYSCCARNIAGMATSSAMVNIEANEDDYAALKYDHSRVVRAHTKPMEDRYDIGDELGRGTQGIVYHAVERATGNSYAAKSMYGKSEAKNLMLHELDIMNQLHDRHIIRARDAFETKSSLILVSDLAAGGELLDNICKQPTISESEIAHYIRQILWGLEHMHNKGIAHLGLTPGDILLSKPGGDDIKICDFGLANRIIKGKDFYLDYGMPEFVAPEIVQHRPVSFATDMWSVGVIGYLLLSGISPFLGNNDRETLKRIQKGQLTFDPQVFTDISDEAKDFLAKLLVFDPESRLDVKSALSHPWLKSADRLGTGNILDTGRLKDYYDRYKEWVRNAACNRFYRRRPLSSANDHPSGMIYPRGERFTPLSSPEPSPTLKTKPDWDASTFTDRVQMEHDDMNYDLGYADSTSRYQNGPDTYLLQLRDVGFPLRLREYMRVSASRSPTLALKLQDTISGQTVTVRERRRFTDVMDEEIDDEKRGELDGLRRRFRSEVSPRSDTKHRLKELLPGLREQEQAPFFREKLHDTAFAEDETVEMSCLVIGEPKPVVTWYRNDVVMSESYRVKISEDSSGRHCIRFNPIKPFDGGIYKVVARNVAGEIACRARLKQGEKPGKPDAPSIPRISDTEALIIWHPPKSNGISPVTSFSLEFKEIEGSSWTEVASNISHHFMIVKNLRPTSHYHFRVKAFNRFGWGDYSNVSQAIKTEESGAPKISISKAMKYQQELTEAGNSISETVQQPVLDYSVEKAPIQISNNVPTEKYNFISEISRGRFSVVVKCCQRSGSEMFAAKLLECTPSSETSILNEYNSYKSLRHERIPCLYEVYQCNNVFVFIEEKLQGVDILTYLTRNSSYSEDTVTRVITQVLDALEYLHFRNIIHLDVQPDNIVLSNLSTAEIKLIDFGSARVSQDSQKSDKRGNPEFTAPEVFSSEDLTVHADVWSVGVLAYVLLSGVSPFRGETVHETTQNVTYVRYRFEHLYKEVTQEATRFLMAVFKKTPQKRPTAEECLELKWLNPSELLIKKRERAIFLSNKLKQFADDYHKQRLNVATSSERLLGAFGMKLSRSISVDYDTLTTF